MHFFTVAAAIVRAFVRADPTDPIVRIAYDPDLDTYNVTTCNDTYTAAVYSDDTLDLFFYSSRSLLHCELSI